MQRDLRQVVNVLNPALLLPRGEDLFVTATDPLGDLVCYSVHRLGYTVGLRQHLYVVGACVKELNINACPTVDGLVVIASDPHVFRRRSNLLYHLPLQRCEVLGLVDEQIVQVGNISVLNVLLDHVNEIVLVQCAFVLD